jgi:protein-S-isoprenylcysteine O-methyltransferase Ste14
MDQASGYAILAASASGAAAPLAYRHGAAETVFIAALATWAVFEFAMRVRQRLLASGPPSRDLTFFVLVGSLVGSIILAEVLGRRGGLPWPGGVVWPFVTGIAMIAAGLLLRAWSIAALGRFFQFRIKVQPGHRVVTSGPYRYVRHPSYTGLALILAGIALTTGDVWSLLVVAVVAGTGLLVRIRAEERQLTQALGPEYETYAAGRKRLVPGVW